MDIYFWAVAIGLGLPLWWFAYIATKRMRIGKNLEREEQARRNLDRFAREQAAKEQTANEQVISEQAVSEQAASDQTVTQAQR